MKIYAQISTLFCLFLLSFCLPSLLLPTTHQQPQQHPGNTVKVVFLISDNYIAIWLPAYRLGQVFLAFFYCL